MTGVVIECKELIILALSRVCCCPVVNRVYAFDDDNKQELSNSYLELPRRPHLQSHKAELLLRKPEYLQQSCQNY
jgi:hypothetical protein